MTPSPQKEDKFAVQEQWAEQLEYSTHDMIHFKSLIPQKSPFNIRISVPLTLVQHIQSGTRTQTLKEILTWVEDPAHLISFVDVSNHIRRLLETPSRSDEVPK